MPVCSECSADDLFLYTCQECGDQYCDEHLPSEKHDCVPSPTQINIIVSGPPSPETEPERSESTNDPISSESTNTAPSIPRPFDSKSHLPSERILAILAVVLLLSGLVAGSYAIYGPDVARGLSQGLGEIFDRPSLTGSSNSSSEVNQTAVEMQLLERLNEFRADQDVSAVDYNAGLAEIAAYHSEDMADQEYVGHVSPTGETVQDRFQRFDFSCGQAGELVLFTQYDREIQVPNGTLHFDTESELASGILTLWSISPDHRNALLTERWEQVGFGVIVTNDNRVYVTMNAC